MEQTSWMAEAANTHGTAAPTDKAVEISVVVPVSAGHDDLEELYTQYCQALSAIGLPYECIFVLKADDYNALQTLRKLRTEHPRVRIVTLHRWQGEATALAVGFEKAVGRIILTLPATSQVEPYEVERVVRKLLEEGPDVVIAWRRPRLDALLNRSLSWLFHQLVQKLTQTKFHDITCGLRAMKRQVAEEVHLYGDLHRFFPLLAYQRGFRVVELPVEQSHEAVRRGFYAPGLYLRRLLDILTVFFLFKFAKRPLRFFGLVGSQLFIAGAIVVGYLGFYRLFEFGGIAGRPLLILGALLMILGAQFFSIGLLGELLIFTHSHAEDYQVQEILE